MSDVTVEDIVPVFRRLKDGAVITQYDYPTAESLGLVKMDFLGLRNLNVIGDAVANLKKNGIDIKLDELAKTLDDKNTYALLARGDTLGVFQLDGTNMRSLLKMMRPDKFDDISACIALYRPGPMGMESHTNYAKRKNGRQTIKPIHPELEEPLKEILDETYGLIVYQEQVQKAAQILAGYSLGAADNLRRAMGKKKQSVLEKEFVPFQKGMRERGYSPAAIKAVWDTLVPFAGYAFNKAHSAAYGLISYWTAYLKANYPAEFMAALLTSVKANKDKTSLYLSECSRMGIKVLPPDVNESEHAYSAIHGTNSIRFGFSGINNVGGIIIDQIIKTRQEKGKFTSFIDFLTKVPSGVCNKRVVESLIKAGAFDAFGENRRSLMMVHEKAIERIMAPKRKEDEGQMDLFAENASDEVAKELLDVEIPKLAEWPKKTLLDFELEMIGMYVSDHPLSAMKGVLKAKSDMPIIEILSAADSGDSRVSDRAFVTIAGMIKRLERKTSKKGNMFAVIQLEDLDSTIEAVFFGKAYEKISHELKESMIVQVKGRFSINADGGDIKILGDDVTQISVTEMESTELKIELPHKLCKPEILDNIKQIFEENSGDSKVTLIVTDKTQGFNINLGYDYAVNTTKSLINELSTVIPSHLVKVE
jgi:DNA polymerase-3 subunit alpha